MRSDRVTHWLPANEANRFPRRIVTFDTETRATISARKERHRFRLAVATADRIDKLTLEPDRTEQCETTDPETLWRFVDGWTRANGRTVVFAHNLGFDLRTSGGLEILPELGWQLSAISLDNYRCWARWKKGSRGLTMVDTASFYPVSLARIATAIGKRKHRLPDQSEPDGEWFKRCRKDVEITRAAVLQLLQWLEGNDMGSFRNTGPAQAEAAYRHRFMPRKAMLVHDHSPAIDAERKSSYTGRAEAWRHGLQPGWLYEWDYRLAYAHLVRRLPVPTRLVGHKYDCPPGWLDKATAQYTVLADVDVDTPTEVVPTNDEGRIVWPTGRFRSTLWDRELQLLELEGGSYKIRTAWLYERAPALRDWAEWIIGSLDHPTEQVDRLQQLMLKSWSRSLIGRFGLRYPTMTEIATSPRADLQHLPYYDDVTGETRYQLQIGHQILEQAGAEEGRNSMPAVMAYVMSAGRVQLWATMRAAGLYNVAYVDTDSILVDQQGHDRLQSRLGAGRGDGLRYKRRMRGVEILGPRMVVTSDDTKIAGLSKNATRTGHRSWEAEYWESAKTAVGHGRASEVVVEKRTFRIKADDRRRRHLADGRTGPYNLDLWEPTT